MNNNIMIMDYEFFLILRNSLLPLRVTWEFPFHWWHAPLASAWSLGTLSRFSLHSNTLFFCPKQRGDWMTVNVFPNLEKGWEWIWYLTETDPGKGASPDDPEHVEWVQGEVLLLPRGGVRDQLIAQLLLLLTHTEISINCLLFTIVA